MRELFFTKVCMIVYRELRGLHKVMCFNFQILNHGYRTRSVTDDMLKLPERPCGGISNALFRTISYVGPRFFNSLSQNVKGLDSFSLFKKNMKNWLQGTQIDIYNLMYTHDVVSTVVECKLLSLIFFITLRRNELEYIVSSVLCVIYYYEL